MRIYKQADCNLKAKYKKPQSYHKVADCLSVVSANKEYVLICLCTSRKIDLNILDIIHLVRSQNLPFLIYLIHTRTCVYQGVRNVSFSYNFANVLNE